jgi:hypothetical protein
MWWFLFVEEIYGKNITLHYKEAFFVVEFISVVESWC